MQTLPLKTKTSRIFFALWPNDATRKRIVETFKHSPQYNMNGRIIRPANFHITLHFIGNVSEIELQCLQQQAAKIKSRKFTLSLDHYSYFQKPRVYWMGLKTIPQSLEILHQKLASAFVECDYHSEQRNYTPHLSLMRKVTHPVYFETFTPIKWDVNEFVLVESLAHENGVEYKIIQHYGLY